MMNKKNNNIRVNPLLIRVNLYLTDIKNYFVASKKGKLSWLIVFQLAGKNLFYGKSRTLLTVGAISLGTAAVVFLVSFGYGLQDIVTKRLVHPNSMRLTDVQSNSTALTLSDKSISQITNISGVADVAYSISLAASLSYLNSRMDVVVAGVENKYLEYANIYPISGEFFSKAANGKYLSREDCAIEDGKSDCSSDLEKLFSLMENGQVAGAETEKKALQIGDLINDVKIRFRLTDDIYLPLREKPEMSARITGYVRGSDLESYVGQEVWGTAYESIGTQGKAYQDATGNWFGKWIKTNLLIYDSVADTVYLPAKDESGKQKQAEGFLGQNQARILTEEQVLLDKQVDRLLELTKRDNVLGVATGEAEQESLRVADLSTSTEAAELKQILAVDKAEKVASPVAQIGMIEVKKKGGKEAVVSTGFLRALKLKEKEIIGRSINLEYIISGGAISGIAGRVTSKPVRYNVVGVVKEDKRSLVFVPLADIESMGIKKFTLAKVLSKTDKDLSSVREKIERLGFSTQSIVDTLAQVDRLFRVMRFLLGAFGMIALVVAVFGMFNTLTISLLERTREIGVMKTLGTTDSDVVRLFLAESTLIGLLGGIGGVFFGVGLGNLLNLIFLFFQQDKNVVLFKAPLTFLIMIFFFSVLVGVLTGIFPSKRAQKISPLDALRYE